MSTINPVIKWAGGKRQLVPLIRDLIPTDYNKYYEPFFGGGALFCDIQPCDSVINDINPMLVNMYEQIKTSPDKICDELFILQDIYNSFDSPVEKDAFYYNIRGQFNEYLDSNKRDVKAAAILIFLNKAGFNGVYRLNSKGHYNVPTAHRKSLNTYDRENIFDLAKLLNSAIILNTDFEEACKSVSEKDFVFFDSPYHDTFDKYQAGGFSEDDHVRLSKLFRELTDRGAYCILTNSNSEFIKDLYKDFEIQIIDVKRMINRDKDNRIGKEILVKNF